MANVILLVFEGARTEPVILNSLLRFYLNKPERTIVKSIFGSTIYSLYHTIKNDPDLDLFLLLKERENNKDTLNGISKDDVSEIYLFFDYDAHDPTAEDEKLQAMLNTFSEETESGKLYISYPMVEAIRHLKDGTPFEATTVECKKKIGYKNVTHVESDQKYRDYTTLNQDGWNHIIEQHCKKLNHLMVSEFSFPQKHFNQNEIFETQYEKYIKPTETVSVLSAIPVFVMDYYGYKALEDLISQ